MSASPSTLVGEFAGRYSVERELGRGATAIVYLARDLELGRSVAIKVLRTELAETITAERFLREIKLTAQLHHPHIVPVLNSGESDKRLFFALPYMDGGTLRDRLKRDKQLPIDDVIAIGKTILSALQFAHERKLLHRDVKPENILFTNGEACLSDFGIARAMERAIGETSTTTGLVRGTPAYMSPEQAAGDKDIDGRSDLYSLACVLYEALAGVPAFVGATPQAVVAQRLTHEPRSIRVYRPSVTQGLEAVLSKALATAPADRYQTAEEFAAALELRAPNPQARRRWGIHVATAAVIVAVATLAIPRLQVIPFFTSSLDTTRVAVLPFVGGGPAIANTRPDDYLFAALRRWRGLELVESFEVADRIKRGASPATAESAAKLAKDLGAGRFIRGELTVNGVTRIVRAVLYDTRSRRPLHEVVLVDSSADSHGVFTSVADSLVLRSQLVPPSAPTEASPSLPATQLMLKGDAALREWDLASAESLYVQAMAFGSSPRAEFWVAQLRAWELRPTADWARLAKSALDDTVRLSRYESRLALALSALADEDFPMACALYRRAIQTNPREFAPWYGLGRCLDADRIVVRDSTTGAWVFRSSYQQAINAYVRAFELLPTVYRSYQANAYLRLRMLLFTQSRYRRDGQTAAIPRQYFIATPTLSHDTLAFFPVAREAVLKGARSADRAATGAAIIRARQIFRRITNAWASAFPESAGSKEGLALALELDGEPAAVDSMRAALALATTPRQKTRLAASLMWLDVRFGLPDDTTALAAAVTTAKTFAATTPLDATDAEVLARFAVVRRDCDRLAVLARKSAVARTLAVDIPESAVADGNEGLAALASGCPRSRSTPSITGIFERLAVDQQPEPVKSILLSEMFARPLRFETSLDLRIAQLVAARDNLVRARLLLLQGDTTGARAILVRSRDNRLGAIRGSYAADAALVEARLWLALGDTSAANRSLNELLSNVRFLPPLDADQGMDNVVNIASLIQAARLKALLDPSEHERARWKNAVQILWGRL